MTETTVTLNGQRVLCNQVTVSGKKNIDVKPYENFPTTPEPVEAQTLPYENLKILLKGVRFPATTADLADTTTLRFSDLLDLFTAEYDGSNGKYTLIVKYGKDVTHTLEGIGTTTGISVVVESFNFPINTTDSKNGYMPVGSITLAETK